MRGRLITYEEFKAKMLVPNYVNQQGKPVHTRRYKKLFYRFNEQLKAEFGFDMHVCDCCGIENWQDRALIMELEHINRITNDARPENLRALCPNCHSQTFGYKNRKITVCELNEHYIEMSL